MTRNIFIFGSSVQIILFFNFLSDKFNFLKNESLKEEKELAYNLFIKKNQLEKRVEKSIEMYNQLQTSYDEIAEKEKEKEALLDKVNEYSTSLETKPKPNPKKILFS